MGFHREKVNPLKEIMNDYLLCVAVSTKYTRFRGDVGFKEMANIVSFTMTWQICKHVYGFKVQLLFKMQHNPIALCALHS